MALLQSALTHQGSLYTPLARFTVNDCEAP